MRTIGFHRDYAGYSGGHGKVFDYFGHVQAHPAFRARVAFAAGSIRDADNPWQDASVEDAAWDPTRYDALFLAGLDWQAVPRDEPRRPVLNLIQGLGHAEPGDPRRAFLTRPAIRICVSQPVAEAIRATGEVNGPVHVIANAIAPGPQRAPAAAADAGARRVFIAGQKQPALADALARRLAAMSGLAVTAQTQWLARADFRAQLAQADIVVALPLAREGFYLPALEAMAAGAATIVTDCVGNRDYARAGETCLMPAASAEALAAAVQRLDEDAELRARLVVAGQREAARHDARAERAAFHALLDRLDTEWATCRPAS